METKKGKKYDTDKYQGHTEGPWYRMHSNDTIRSEPMGDNAEAHLFDIVGATTVDAELAADAPRILQALIDEQAEVKRLRRELKYYTDNCTIVWQPEDVLSVDGTLTDKQVSWVLGMMERKHDASLGISWTTIEFWASEAKSEID